MSTFDDGDEFHVEVMRERMPEDMKLGAIKIVRECFSRADQHNGDSEIELDISRRFSSWCRLNRYPTAQRYHSDGTLYSHC